MDKQYELTPEKAIYQLTNAVLALARALSHVSPEVTQAHLAAAIKASEKKGFGSNLIREVYEIAFPNAGAIIDLSEEEFEKRFGAQKP
ncbi:hypothetical protein [Pseudomonas gingeri]